MAKRKFALDIYMSRMFKTIMLFIPLIALSAGICFTILKGCGFYTSLNWTPLVIFDCSTIIYCILGLFFALNCEDENKNLKNKYVFAGKIVIIFVIAIQWNFISYMIPSRDFWAFFALFIFVAVFFLDSRFVLFAIIAVLASMFISWAICGDALLPVRDEYFVPEVILRCILIFFVSLMMYLITFIVERLLVKELENIAEFDSLTLLRNRRTLNYKMDEAINNFEKENQIFCFLMADIDDFKVVNDKYGHPFGDIVLKNIANIFVSILGDNNYIFRYGGEEICAIMKMNVEEANKTADLLRQRIQATVHSSGDIKVQVTMSMGLVEYKKGMNRDEMIKISDSNLYYAKNHGKNKVIN